MRIVVLGAGGIGGYYGARLQAAGHQVCFVARGAHLAAMQQQGLTVKHPAFTQNLAVDACSLDALAAKFPPKSVDLVLLAAKSDATASMLYALKNWLEAGSMAVMSLQNGVDNEAAISQVVGEARTLGGLAVFISGHVVAPGKVQAHGNGELVYGAWPNVNNRPMATLAQQLAPLFSDAGIKGVASDDIRRELWRKLMINNGVNPITALTGFRHDQVYAKPALANTVRQLMREVALASTAEGVNLSEADVEALFARVGAFPSMKTSMLVDREKGRPMELDAICGAVLTRVASLGKTAPVTELLYGLLKDNITSLPSPDAFASPLKN
ncbi:ketopantoate reductase family protein [Gallaecimonas mangrovi]|uniref:ketopantoate reductase family protein n=1 Tax=Gallaecimonas mangrovi TaxID=2291597 RepID=UPI000E1FD10B|nr:2-dehydropantoate 2-reductase [Gallaecimonas mangrovi]